MPKSTTLTVQGTDIAVMIERGDDYFSLTDIAKRVNEENPAATVNNRLRNKDTIEFIGTWEILHNSDFNLLEFEQVKNEAGTNRFYMSTTKWVSLTNARGIITKAGRYDGGTFAHKDIALEFCSWISPVFKLYLIKEFQRLKVIEAEQQKGSIEWDIKRTLAKINYRIHTDAVKMHLIPTRITNSKQVGMVYASEADMLNVALFGITAKQWQEMNPTLKGNIRDYAMAEQLLVLANLENINAHLIKEGLSQEERFSQLHELAIYQMGLLSDSEFLKHKIKGIEGKA